MRRFIYLAILVVACATGCAKEYEPPAESIPVITPSTRGGGGGGAGAVPGESPKESGGDKAAGGKKGGAVAP